MTLIKKETRLDKKDFGMNPEPADATGMWYVDSNSTDTNDRKPGGWKKDKVTGGRVQLGTSKPHSKLTEAKDYSVSTDDDSTARCITNISSASSSISWAEDAVEAELTQKIFLMWEDIQEVCISETVEKPMDMPVQVFEECLHWRRAFPKQDLSRFMRFAEIDIIPVPNTVQIQEKISPKSSVVFDSTSPESGSFSSQSNCSTPNPERSSLFVTSWLADCQRNQEEGKAQDDNANENGNIVTLQVPPSMLTPSVDRISNRNHYQEFQPNKYNNFAYPSNVTINYDNRQNSAGLRVQRPISSSMKGHLLTPLPTESSHARVSRDTGSSRIPTQFEPGNLYGLAPSETTARIPKGKTAPVQSVCPPTDVHMSKARSSGPRRTTSKLPNADKCRNNRRKSNIAHHPIEDKGMHCNSGSNPRNRMSSSGSYQNMGSVTSSTRVIQNSYSSGFVSSLPQTTSWSRHSSSSIYESYSFLPKDTGNSGDMRYMKTESHKNVHDKFLEPESATIRPRSIDEEEINPSNRLQPVRPFLYWLLDKVSPT